MPDYTFDHADLNFSCKFKAVRSFHQLTTRELAALLNYKSASNIAFLEKYPMSSKPTFQLLVSMNQLFGLSIDWLLGLSEIPYTEESVRQAEIAQDERLIVDSLVIPADSDAPENIMSSIKEGIFPRKVIQEKLVLRDRFTLIFLLNYISYALEQYYVQNHSGILKKKLQGLAEILGFKNSSSLMTNPDGVTNTLKKHPEFASAFLQFVDTLKSPFGIPYTLHPALVLPGQFKPEKLEHTIMDDRWDFLSYLEKNKF